MPFQHSIAGGQGNLVVASLKSPNYDPLAGTGWQIAKDGSATFYDVSLPNVGTGTKVTFGSTAPVSPSIGDVWYDTANGLEASVWNGSAWVPFQISSGAIATGGVDPSNISSLTASLIGNTGGVLNPNPYFTGGDATGWRAVFGSMTLVSGAGLPSGAPYPYALHFTASSARSEIGMTSPVNVTAGQQYMISAWVYSSVDTTVGLFFAWQGATTTFNSATIPLNTWTQVTSVATAPVGATGLSAEINSNNGNMYASAILVMPQVPGTLIQAGTVTAAQIAAGTITAAEIAAGTVFAGIVNGTTITGGTLIISQGSGATFEQIEINGATGVTTWSKYQSPTVVIRQTLANGTDLIYADPGSGGAQGGLVSSVSPVAGTDGFGNSYQAGHFLYETGGNAMAGLMWSTVAGSQPLLALFPDSTFGFTGHSPFVQAFVNNRGLTSEYLGLGMGPGAPSGSSSPNMIIMYSASPDGTTSVPHVSIYGGSPVQLIVDINENGIVAADPVTPNIDETWHTLAVAAPWTNTAGNPIRYRMLPDKNVQFTGNATAAAQAGTTTLSASPLPVPYRPAHAQDIGPGFVSSNIIQGVAVATSGVVQVRSPSGTTTTCNPQGSYPVN